MIHFAVCVKFSLESCQKHVHWLTLGGAFEPHVALKPEYVVLESDVNCTSRGPGPDAIEYGAVYKPCSSLICVAF